MKKIAVILIPGCLLAASVCGLAIAQPAFKVTSPTVQDGQPLAIEQVFNGMGCEGGNVSPQLDWSNAPEGTKSFAVTMFDPDVPSGSGWWHWLIYDIPANLEGLPADIAMEAPDGMKQGPNDAGYRVYGGACPPEGYGAHHYEITVFALGVDELPVPPDASAALIGVMLNMNALGKASITATYER
jgi:Raf kinase inhibitor-like YbhB/YbcL family protein